MADPLGKQLAQVRRLRGLSLKATAEPAGISAAYLQKLERSEVQKPSPNILHRLAGVLEIPYSDLMELAGYVVPRSDFEPDAPGVNMLAHALSGENITEDEAAALAEYLAFYRSQRRSRGG